VRRVDRPLLVLLPEPLEAFAHRGLVDELLATGLAVAADPPRAGYRRQARIPDAFSVGVAHKQARRLRKRLRDEPRVVVIFDPAQYQLARGLLQLVPGCELWYEHTAPIEAGDLRRAELHGMAAERARLRFVASDRDAIDAALQRLVATKPSGTDPAT
jgi:plasmid stabilization system protein ParE